MTSYRFVNGTIEAVTWPHDMWREPESAPMPMRFGVALTRRERRREARKGSAGRRTARRVRPTDLPRFVDHRYTDWRAHLLVNDVMRCKLFLPVGTPLTDEHIEALQRFTDRAQHVARAQKLFFAAGTSVGDQ